MTAPEGSLALGATPADCSDVWRRLALDAAASFGTPCYLVRWLPVQGIAETFEGLFDDNPIKLWLSFKTHPVIPLALEWIASGRGVEVVSEFEFVALMNLECPTDQLLVNGVAKHTWLHRHSVPNLRVHFDSLLELKQLLPLAAAERWRIGLRCHMPLESDGSSSSFGGQFGMTEDEFGAACALVADFGLTVEGVHFHLGFGARQANAYTESVQYVCDLCTRYGVTPSYIDCGGGLNPGDDSALADFQNAVRRARTLFPQASTWAEHGRYLTHSSTVLICGVVDVKKRIDCRYLICDGGRTNHALAADAGIHPLLTLPQRDGRLVLTTITGATCMTDDRLGRVLLPDDVGPGDLIVWFDAGAYHLPWETRFSQGLCAVVWCDENDEMSLARTRETPEEWGRLWNS